MAREAAAGAGVLPSLTEDINVANITYSQPGVGYPFPKMFPDGLKLLMSHGRPVTDYSAATGFYGAAFVTPRDRVIVGFEGTNPNTGNDVFTAAQVADDSAIYFGVNAPSYSVALRFTRLAIHDAAARGISRADVSLAGHSLGAADAEYVAANTGLAGTTFGAPGIPVTDSVAGVPARLTNYVEAGDPVGNYAAGSPLGSIVTSGAIQHYGGETIVGSDPYRLLPNAATAHRYGDYPAELAFLGAAIPNHYLAHYASDLHVKLAGSDNTVGSDASFFQPVAPVAAVARAAVPNAVCYCVGTLIRTPRGEVAVEALEVGDLVLTASGEKRPVKWLGQQTVDCRAHHDPAKVLPVRIAKDAFGPSRPAADLWLSPGHSVCVDIVGELLVPIGELLNGATVAQVAVDEVTYWHVELDTHDILVANGLPAESYMDVGNRAFFVDGVGVPDGVAATTDDYCRPFVTDFTLLRAMRLQLQARALAQGWQRGATDLNNLYVEADGAVVRPDLDGLVARFALPATAADVWLVSDTFVPAHMDDSPDTRTLGVHLRGLVIDDGLAPARPVAIDDRLVCVGFHEPDGDNCRWTTGRARLSAAFWAGCRGQFCLQVELNGIAPSRWIAPEALALSAAPIPAPPPRLRLVAPVA